MWLAQVLSVQLFPEEVVGRVVYLGFAAGARPLAVG